MAIAEEDSGTQAATVSVVITSSSVANPSNILCAAVHGLTTGDSVLIAGHSGETPSIAGRHTVTVVDTTNFTIPVNVTVGGTGGTISKVEHILDTWTTNEKRYVEVDLNTLEDGDIVELTIYVKDANAGVDRIMGKPATYGQSGWGLEQSAPFGTLYGGKVTLKQTAGVSRNFDWRVFTID